jgi:predicted esterase
VLWSGYLPPELAPGPDLLHGARLTWVLGAADAYTPAPRITTISAELQRAGLAHDLRWYDGGHRIESDPLRALAAALAPPAP